MLQIKEEENQAYCFELSSLDGIILLRSVRFNSKKQLKKAIEALNPSTLKSFLFERKTNYEGKFLFQLKNSDQQLLGKSDIFESEAGMENGIKHLKKRISDLAPSFVDL